MMAKIIVFKYKNQNKFLLKIQHLKHILSYIEYRDDSINKQSSNWMGL